MASQAPDNEEVRREFRRRWNRQLILWGVAIGAIVVAAAYDILHPDDDEHLSDNLWLLCLVGAMAIWSVFNWRCPACRRMFRRAYPRYCGDCGVQLR